MFSRAATEAASAPVAASALSGRSAPATGVIAAKPTSFLLKGSMRSVSFLVPVLWYQHSIALWLDVPEPHHGVVFMHHVVTMNRVLAQPVAEAEEQEYALVGVQLRH